MSRKKHPRKLRTLIVEDDPAHRTILRTYLEQDCAEWVEIETAVSSVVGALDVLRSSWVDVMFCDVELQDGRSFEILDALGDNINFTVIFTTQHEHFAAQAFDYKAFDFVPKPTHKDRVRQAVQRVYTAQNSSARLPNGVWKPRIQTQVLEEQQNHAIPFPKCSSLRFSDVAYIQAADDYTQVHLLNGKTVMTDVRLKAWEEYAEKYGFARVHRSTIVNSLHIREIQTAYRNCSVTLATGAPIKVTEAYRLSLYSTAETKLMLAQVA